MKVFLSPGPFGSIQSSLVNRRLRPLNVCPTNPSLLWVKPARFIRFKSMLFPFRSTNLWMIDYVPSRGDTELLSSSGPLLLLVLNPHKGSAQLQWSSLISVWRIFQLRKRSFTEEEPSSSACTFHELAQSSLPKPKGRKNFNIAHDGVVCCFHAFNFPICMNCYLFTFPWPRKMFGKKIQNN